MIHIKRGDDHGAAWVGKVIFIGILVLVFGAIVVSTQYRSAEEGAAIASGLNPDKNFDPAAKAAELFPTIVAELPGKATDLTVLAPAVTDDLPGAGAQYGQDLGAGSYAFPVKVTGTVESADDKFMVLKVEGMGADQTVVVPTGPALNGGPVRDALGIIEFGDVPGQIEYQTLAQELKKLMIADVLKPADPASLAGTTITVYGAYKSGGPKDTWIIQPVKIEAAP